jgi:hypothetical protein
MLIVLGTIVDTLQSDGVDPTATSLVEAVKIRSKLDQADAGKEA